MIVTPLEIPEILLIEPKIYGDSRGFLLETYQRDRYVENGITGEFNQDNMSFSGHGVLRGLHLQDPNGQAKLVQVADGEIFDVAVDVRPGSPTFGRWIGATLSSQNRHQLWIPKGFAHGFVVTGDHALVCYKVDGKYAPSCEHTLLWDDPEVGVRWPLTDVSLSAKDLHGKTLRELEVVLSGGTR